MLRNVYNNKTEATFHDILDKYQIDPEHTNVFEEFILKLAGIKENIYRSPVIHFQDEYGEFHLPISKASAEMVLQLNDDFPSLNITDVTYDNAIPTFRVNAEALRILILPLLASYLENNPLEVERYQHFSLTAKIVFKKFMQQINLDKLHAGNDFLFPFISENAEYANLIKVYSKNIFPENGLISLVLAYLNISNMKTLSKDIKKTISEEDAYDMQICPGDQNNAESINHFLNNLYSSTATIQPNDDKTSPIKILVKYGTFLHPAFISNYRDFRMHQTITNATKAIKKALNAGKAEDEEYQKFFRAGHHLLHEIELNGVNNAPLINALIKDLGNDNNLTEVCESLRYIANKEWEKSPSPAV